ncbi:MAG TPA: GNAT family N-acetyltransferase [Lysobacter sp.]|nr:GNAT family N-acetyltransferase [Lysobacter sp.]
MTAAFELAPSPLESARFGLRVVRGQAQALPERELLVSMLAHEADVAILRGPAPLAGHVMQRYGMAAIHADTLVYYGCDLRRTTPQPLRNDDLAFALATPDDRAELEALVATTFADYHCHYHANPLFDPACILEGYTEWALGYVVEPAPGRSTWVARRAGRMVAFATCMDDGQAGEGVLYGVHPDHAGGGLYSDLIRYTQRAFAERGRAGMRVSTQVWNYAVQKVWSREGFWLSQALDTWHFNPLLSAGEVLCDRDVTFSQAQVERFADVSGDANPLHLDPAAARAAGFDGTLSHGMLAGAELSRLFGMEVPGPGTLFLRASLAFLQPVYAGRPHRLTVRALPRPVGRARLAVARLADADGRACLLAYSDLLRKS